MDKEQQKRDAAEAALAYIAAGEYLGVGTGSTVEYFIEALARQQRNGELHIAGAVASSRATARRLDQAGIHVVDANAAGTLPVYVDGADETDRHLRLIKGGGAALTGEKILAGASRRFVCIVDKGKRVRRLGDFPLPVEAIPMARSFVARQLAVLGGHPQWREDVVTDHGNVILDVRGLNLTDPLAMEDKINALPGVVTVGLFARRGADILLTGTDQGVETFKR
jgi:ribose 5-phosphate isomerase A